MTSLLQEQQRLQRLTLDIPVAAPVDNIPDGVTTNPMEVNSSLKFEKKSGQKAECGCSQSKTSWLRSVERRLTLHVQRTVRTEIRKALRYTRSSKQKMSL